MINKDLLTNEEMKSIRSQPTPAQISYKCVENSDFKTNTKQFLNELFSIYGIYGYDDLKSQSIMYTNVLRDLKER